MKDGSACAWWLAFLLGCAGSTATTVRGTAADGTDGLVRGRVIRVTGSGSTFDGPLDFGPRSRARIGLYSNPALGGDGESTLVAEQVIAPAKAPPFDFEITGSRAALEALKQSSRLSYYVTVRVEQRAGELTLGDLNSEAMVTLVPPADGITVEVTGLEACDSPGAGGFCL